MLSIAILLTLPAETYLSWIRRYSIGQLFATAALKVLSRKDPYNYLTLIYTEWAMLVSPSNAAYRERHSPLGPAGHHDGDLHIHPRVTL
jgi:hypothetical protein